MFVSMYLRELLNKVETKYKIYIKMYKIKVKYNSGDI